VETVVKPSLPTQTNISKDESTRLLYSVNMYCILLYTLNTYFMLLYTVNMYCRLLYIVNMH